MRSLRVGSSFANLEALAEDGPSAEPLMAPPSTTSLESGGEPAAERPDRLILVSNQLPVRMKRCEGELPEGAAHGWLFEWDEDSLVGQAKAGIEAPQFDGVQARRVLAYVFLASAARISAPRRLCAAASHASRGRSALLLRRRSGARGWRLRITLPWHRALPLTQPAAQAIYVGGLPQEVSPDEQDAVSADLFSRFACMPGASCHPSPALL